jgi:hypothetical protein
MRAPSGLLAVLDSPGTPRSGRSRNPGSNRFLSTNEKAGLRLAQPDNVGKAYLKAVSALGWEAGVSYSAPRA